MLHQTLWEANLDLARASLSHPFVQGLGEGNLDPAAFRRYVAQDAFFLKAFFRAYALVAVKCERHDQARDLWALMGGVLDELELHARYARSLDIDLERVQPLAAVRAYTDFLLATAWGSPPGETLAALVPCMRLYAWLGQQLAPRLRPDHPYRDWIETYASDDFEALARRVEGLLDALAEDGPRVREAYHNAMVCEREFFGAPLYNAEG